MSKIRWFRFICLSLIPSLLLYGLGCSAPKSDNFLVAVTILPQQEFVENIVGEKPVETMVLIPPGASPATYELSPSQMQKLANARIYFKLGSGIPFENLWLDKIAELNPGMRIIDCSSGIEILSGGDDEHKPDHEHGRDPHIWCSPRNARIIVANITAGLIDLDQDYKETYEKNALNYDGRLAKLDDELKEIFAAANNRNFIIFHPSWGYFGRDYDLNQIAIEIEGKEPHAADLKKLVDLAKEKNIKTVFASPQFNTASAEMIAHEINGQVEFIDHLAKNYIENMRQVAARIVKAMK